MQGTYLFFQVTINTFVKMTTTVSSDKSDTLTVRRTFVLTCDEKFAASKRIDVSDTYNAERLSAIGNRALCERTAMFGNQSQQRQNTYFYPSKVQRHRIAVCPLHLIHEEMISRAIIENRPDHCSNEMLSNRTDRGNVPEHPMDTQSVDKYSSVENDEE